MDSIADSKTEFRKPSNDAASRKYRRRSPIGGGSSSSSDGSPQRKQSSGKDADDKRSKDDGVDGDYGGIKSGRGGESYKHSDRQSSRSYHRHDDHSRRDRRVDDRSRGYSKSSHHSGREKDLDYSRGDKEFQAGDFKKYPRGKSDGSGSRSRDKDSSDRAGYSRRHNYIEDKDKDNDRVRHREDRGGRDGKSDRDHKVRSPSYQESKGQQNEPSSGRDTVHHVKEASQKEVKELDGERYANDEKRRFGERDRHKEHYNREQKEQLADEKAFLSRKQDSVAKKPKVSGFDSAVSGENEQAYVTDSDIDAAKIAAMKAAELVNKNLVGTGYMSTDQKKKLLWGSKKNTTTDESAHRWDSTMFGDRERQEKFNKLMGVKGEVKVEQKSDNPDVEKQREQLQLELEKQYTAGLRRRDGRTVGLGL